MQQTNKIKMIYTGGTIGMKISAQGLLPDIHSIQQFLHEHHLCDQIDLVYAQPLIDSSAVQIINWNQWLFLIRQDLHKYQGVIILHGTDTLAYTAALISLVYSSLPSLPIVITGAMQPLANENSDGQNNIFLSIEALKLLDQGVVVVFNDQILHAADCVKINSLNIDAFCTPHTSVLGKYHEQVGWQWNSNFNYSKIIIDSSIDYYHFTLRPDIKILNLFLTPSIVKDMHIILAKQDWDAIILQSFGNGNFRLENPSKQIIQNYIHQDKPVINVSQVLTARVDKTYVLGSEISNLGCISGNALTFEFCYTATITALSLLTIPCEQTNWIKHILLTVDQQLS